MNLVSAAKNEKNAALFRGAAAGDLAVILQALKDDGLEGPANIN